MSDVERQPEDKPAKRGEAAWKEAKEAVARRNEEVSKVGRQRREEFERTRDAMRMDARR